MRLGVPVVVWVIFGVAAGLSGTPGGAQELRLVSAADQDGTVPTEASQGATEQHFDLVRDGAAGPAGERVADALPDAASLQEQFGKVDQDGDGRISRDEWLQWFGTAYASGDQNSITGRD